MAKANNVDQKKTITVIKECDVYATDFKLELRKETPQEKLEEFVEKFKDNPEYLQQLVKIK